LTEPTAPTIVGIARDLSPKLGSRAAAAAAAAAAVWWSWAWTSSATRVTLGAEEARDLRCIAYFERLLGSAPVAAANIASSLPAAVLGTVLVALFALEDAAVSEATLGAAVITDSFEGIGITESFSVGFISS
jgi:hypothetical protein